MNNFIIRFIIFSVAIYFAVVLVFAWCGINIYDDFYKPLCLYAIYIFAKDNPQYNCVYARFLALSLSVTELITYVDNKFSIFVGEYELYYLVILSIIWSITILITIYLSINHFRRVKRLKRK